VPLRRVHGLAVGCHVPVRISADTRAAITCWRKDSRSIFCSFSHLDEARFTAKPKPFSNCWLTVAVKPGVKSGS